VPIPDSSVRSVLESGVKRVGSYDACAGSVYEGTGFLASVVRGVITSLGIFSATPFPQRVFATKSDCVTWTAAFARRTGMPLSREEKLNEALAHVVEAARRLGVLGGS
jgi:hypothetical protein